MKKNYTAPEMTVSAFKTGDIITLSVITVVTVAGGPKIVEVDLDEDFNE